MIPSSQVNGSIEYIAMMKRFATASPSQSQSLRQSWFCKIFPYLCPDAPLTSDERRIADVFTKLKQGAETKTGNKLDSAVVAIPALPGLQRDAIARAASTSGLKVITTSWHIGDVTQISAGYAGSGRGLCRHYTDIDVCEEEMYEPPPRHVLAIHFDLAALRVVYTYMQHAVSLHPNPSM